MNPSVSPEQLQDLLAQHGGALALFAAQWTDSPEDCVQEAFLELVRQPTTPRNSVAWLFDVVRKRAIDMHRAAQRRRQHETAVGAAAATSFLPARSPEVDAQAIAAALQELAAEQREVIVARVWGGLSFEQIGTLVGVSTSAAHRRYEAGLRALRERLQP
jgi:RNA polymerase sigma-70 factor (ECF subfamily)